jgi:hypothetical protein
MAEKGAGAAGSTLDMREQFMSTLAATMARLRDMYPACERTQRHVGEFLKHVDEGRTRERSIKMWHRSMEPHYVAISQTKNAERSEAALVAGLRANWFMNGLGMAEKWHEEAFAPSRERFLQTIRVLNGLAFLQHSFLGKLAGALSQVTERLAASQARRAEAAGAEGGGGEEEGMAGAAASAMGMLDDPALLDVMPQLLEIIQPETLHEINRMLPHVTHILGGKERLLAMLDQTLGEGGPMKGVLDQVLGALLGGGGEGGAAGAAGAAAGAEGDSATDAPSAASPLSASGFASTLREIIERVSDPDNDTAFTDTLASMGLDVSAAMVGGGGGEGGTGGLALGAEDIRAAFEGFREQFGEGALGQVLSGLSESGGEGFSMESLAAMAAGAVGAEEGEGAETVARLTAAISALQSAAATHTQHPHPEGAPGGSADSFAPLGVPSPAAKDMF